MSKANKKVKARLTKGERVASNISTLLTAMVGFLFIVPLFWIVVSTFKVDAEIHRAGGFIILPITWTMDNLWNILDPANTFLPVVRWFFNSMIVSTSHTILALFVFSSSAYAYAKLQFKGKHVIFLGMLFLSSFPAIVNIIPLYYIMLTFGWLNSPLALVIPGLSGVFSIFLIRQFMYGIPKDLLDSAKIDGCGEFRIYGQIMVPLCKPILIIVGLFSFTGNWNDFLWPSIAINDLNRLTLTPGLQLARGQFLANLPQMSAIAVIAIFPMVIIFLFAQRYFIRGVSLSSGVKG